MARRQGLSTSKAEVARRIDLFIAAYAQTGDGASAAIAAGYSPNAARNRAEKLLQINDVASRAREAREAVVNAQKDTFQRQQDALKAACDGAITALINLTHGKLPEGDLGRGKVGAQALVLAATAILDRAGHKPIERVQQEVAWADVSRELADMDVEAVLVDAVKAIQHDKT